MIDSTASAPVKYTRKNPYFARLTRSEILTKPGSEKDTRHFEIDLAGSGMMFQPGDSLAVQPENCPALVTDLLDVLGCTGEESVPDASKNESTLRDALLRSYAITQPDRKLLAAVAEKSRRADKLRELLEPGNKEELEKYLWGREVIDILMEHGDARFEADEFVALLKKLNARLYSIASSLRAFPEEVHLTIAMVRYETFGRKRKGVCSTYLAERCSSDTRIPTFITPGKGFRLPEPDDPTPIIMCGPGTGIAPFRAFLQERRATGAKGSAWLFFGEQHEASDFFYRDEFKGFLSDGTLTELTTAFSRDQDDKIYVQHRMMERARELWEWLEQGAIFYVCGDAARMAVDVDRALHDIIESEGGRTREEAAAYVDAMKAEKRYRRDVY